jgi:nicotinamide riboside transporter PnuC
VIAHIILLLMVIRYSDHYVFTLLCVLSVCIWIICIRVDMHSYYYLFTVLLMVIVHFSVKPNAITVAFRVTSYTAQWQCSHKR